MDKIKHIEKLIEEIFGEDTDYRYASVAYSPNRCLVQSLIFDYRVVIHLNEIDKESDNAVLNRLLREMKETKKAIELDINLIKNKLNNAH